MALLNANDISKAYGADEIFSGITVEIPQRGRVAMVGPNGAGKTSLLRILMGQDTPDSGTVSTSSGLRMGFLPQRPELHAEHTLREEAMTAFTDLLRMEKQLNDLENALANGDDVLDRYGKLQVRFEEAGGYTYENRMKTVLHGLGFTEAEYDRKLGTFSGGQKTRALLGRLLLEAPDLLILDEPTNHLDIAAVEWLEGYLKDFEGGLLVVSHDRYFIDAIANVVWEMDFGTIETYRGNYSHYVQQREERHERLLKEYEAQQEFIAKEEDYIRRNIEGQNTRQAQGRRKRLERLKRDRLVKRPQGHDKLNLRIQTDLRSGDKVLMTEALEVGYPDKPLFDVPDITLYRGEVAALIGPNGVGKSTFLKTILEEHPPLNGQTRLGASVEVGYFAQAHELLDPKRSIIDEILSVEDMPISAARNYLAQFLFTGDDVFRPIESLSGGERGRVALAKLALAGANFLLLDEPTNHLDIASQEVLEAVLDNFAGTILLVSHDRYLVDALATQIWAASPGELNVFEGRYRDYVAQREAERQAEIAAKAAAVESTSNGSDKPKPSTKKNGLNPYEAKKRADALEAHILELEAKLEDITANIETASTAGDAGRVHELGVAYTETETALHDAMTEWESLVD